MGGCVASQKRTGLGVSQPRMSSLVLREFFHFSGFGIPHARNEKLGLSFPGVLPTTKFQGLVKACDPPSKQSASSWLGSVSVCVWCVAQSLEEGQGSCLHWVHMQAPVICPWILQHKKHFTQIVRTKTQNVLGAQPEQFSCQHSPFLESQGESTDGSLTLLQAEHLGFCGCRVFLLKGVYVANRQPWSLWQAPSLANFHGTSTSTVT